MRTQYWSVAACIMSLAGCGGSDGGGSGTDDLLVGQDCPDECIPRCHFVAFSAFGECFPHGMAVCEGFNHCYENGIKMQSSQSSNLSTLTYYKNGEVCWAYYADHGGVATELERLTLRGVGDRLLEVVEFASPTSRDVFTVTCDGMVRNIDLVVNATNPACASCPEDPFAFPANPDPPVGEYQDCDIGMCMIP